LEAARTAILYAFDLIEHDGEDLRDRPFLERKAALAPLLRNTKASCSTSTFPKLDRPCSPMRASSGPRASCRKTYRSSRCRVQIKVRNPASIAVQRERSEICDPKATGRSGRCRAFQNWI
jgi:bifunctional non-homologous end joining protein LigD